MERACHQSNQRGSLIHGLVRAVHLFVQTCTDLAQFACRAVGNIHQMIGLIVHVVRERSNMIRRLSIGRGQIFTTLRQQAADVFQAPPCIVQGRIQCGGLALEAVGNAFKALTGGTRYADRFVCAINQHTRQKIGRAHV